MKHLPLISLSILFFALPAVAQVPVAINEVMASNAVTLTDGDGDASDWIEIHNWGDESVALLDFGLSDDYDRPFRWVFPDVSIQPGGFLLVWASGKDRRTPGAPLHTNFSIAQAGEEVLLTAPDGERVDELAPRPIPTDVSVGRQPDGTGEWRYFSEPTPGEPNTTTGYSGLTSPPDFSMPGGLYTEGFNLEITADPGTAVYYTRDGSAPDPANLDGKTYRFMHGYPNGALIHRRFYTHTYSNPISIRSRAGDPNWISVVQTAFDGFPRPGAGWEPPSGEVFKSSVVRAIAVAPDSLPSPITTATYFVDDEMPSRYTLPIISLSTSEDGLFDYDDGIYVPGRIFNEWRIAHPHSPLNGGSPANYLRRGREWELPAHIEFYEPGGELAFAQDVGIRIHGGWSRVNRQKALRVYARNTYDEEGSILHEIFPGHQKQGGEGRLQEFKRLILHISGQDNGLTMFRDAMAQSLIAHTGIDTQAYRPAIVFLNGEYWGIHNIRERYDHHYVATNYDLDPEDVVILERNSQIVAGDPGDQHHYQQLVQFVANRAGDGTIDQPEVYAEIEKRMDIENFIHHYAAQIYYANIDWPANNLRWWRYKGEPDPDRHGHDGKWRWMMYDTDHGYGLFVTDGWGGWRIESDHNTVSHATGTGTIIWSNPAWATQLFRSLLQSTTFRNRFINTFADHLNSAFTPARVMARIDEMQAVLAPEYPEYAKRWNHPSTFWHGGDTWEEKIDVMRTFGSTRPPFVRQHLSQEFSLGTATGLTVDVAGDGGRVRINSIVLGPETPGVDRDPYPWSGYYFPTVPVELEALPYPGYRFVRWRNEHGTALGTAPVLSLSPGSTPGVTAEFALDPEATFFPEPFPLDTGPYTFQSWPADSAPGAYPPHMVFEQTQRADPMIEDEMDSYWTLPYDLTSRSRVVGLGDDGFAFINTSNAQEEEEAGYLGSAILSIDTLGEENLRLYWTGGTVRPNSRVYGIRVQYRIGDAGAFTDLADANGLPVEYLRHEDEGHFEAFGPIDLPEELNDRPCVQLRWKYYYTGQRLDPESGQRSKLRVTSILVAGDDLPAEAVFLPGGSGDWNTPGNWSNAEVPDGPDARATVKAPAHGDREISLSAPVTLGTLIVDNEDSPFRNRIGENDTGNILTFSSSTGAAAIEVSGDGTGFAEFDVHAGVILASDVAVTVNQLAGDAEFGGLRLRRPWSGPGGLTKDGDGVMSLTGDGKDYQGATVINRGVLRVTESSAPSQTAALRVNPGGQLRLVSTGENRFYQFGSTIELNSAGRGGDVPTGENEGLLGALRLHPGSNDSTATVANDIALIGDSGIHVDGTRNLLDLSGSLTGPGVLLKSGGGTLVLSGDNSAYSAPVSVTTGTLRLDSEIGSDISLDSDTVLTGSGRAGRLGGIGTVAVDGGTLTATGVEGLHFRFALRSGANPGQPDGSAVLRLTGETPFQSAFNAANTIELFLDSPPGPDAPVHGGFFTDDPHSFSVDPNAATVRFFIEDTGGDTEFAGITYREYDGELPLALTSVPADLDFGAGSVSGRILAVIATGSPTSYEAWLDAHFEGDDRDDPALTAPDADPTGHGVANLLRYALDLPAGAPARDALPETDIESEALRLVFHRDSLKTDIAYVVEASNSLQDWTEIVYDSRIDPRENDMGPRISVVDPIPLDEAPSGKRFLRLQIILLD